MPEAVQTLEQFGIDEGLNEAVALGPAEPRVRWRHLREQASSAVEEPQDLIRHGVRQHRLDQADALEGAQCLVIEPHPAGIVDQRVAFLGHQGANPLQPKHIGQGQPNRSGADHDDVDVRCRPVAIDRHAHRPNRKSMCSRLNVLGSSYCGQCPQPAITSNRAPGIICAMRRPSPTSAVGSSLVHSTNVGALIAP